MKVRSICICVYEKEVMTNILPAVMLGGITDVTLMSEDEGYIRVSVVSRPGDVCCDGWGWFKWGQSFVPRHDFTQLCLEDKICDPI